VVFGLDGIFSAGQNENQSRGARPKAEMPGQAGHDGGLDFHFILLSLLDKVEIQF
jgi:hypothetical protein